jgi:hypothetical protein
LDGLGVHSGGLFWFFAPSNPEMLVKVLNGCGVNERYWVFLAAGTNVGLTVRVRDTVSGRTWQRENPDSTPLPTVQDTAAMPCG